MGTHRSRERLRPKVGDEVVLTGTVSEFFDQTEIGSASATVVASTGAIAPFDASPPADPTDAQRYWERHEGMFASVPSASVVDSPTHFYRVDRRHRVLRAQPGVVDRAPREPVRAACLPRERASAQAGTAAAS